MCHLKNFPQCCLLLFSMDLFNVFILLQAEVGTGQKYMTIKYLHSSIFASQAGMLKGCLLLLILTRPCYSFVFLLGATLCYTFSHYCTTNTFTQKTTFISPFSTKGWKKGFYGNRTKPTKPEQPNL